MRDPETLKKSESIEIRLPYASKQAFMARCRSNGSSASGVLRAFIQDYVSERRAARSSKQPVRLLAGAAAVLAFAALAAPSLAHPSLPAQFARLDADHDGGVSLAEFTGGAALKVMVSVGAAERDSRLDADTRDRLLRAEFSHIDANRDGRISFIEFRDYYGRWGSRRP
jgi:hypothetical protein